MGYQVIYGDDVLKKLKKMDSSVRKLIVHWIEKNLVGCADPRAHGKGLTANRSGYWRYRIGDYRLLATIDEGKILILLLELEHRSEVYKQ